MPWFLTLVIQALLSESSYTQVKYYALFDMCALSVLRLHHWGTKKENNKSLIKKFDLLTLNDVNWTIKLTHLKHDFISDVINLQQQLLIELRDPHVAQTHYHWHADSTKMLFVTVCDMMLFILCYTILDRTYKISYNCRRVMLKCVGSMQETVVSLTFTTCTASRWSEASNRTPFLQVC